MFWHVLPIAMIIFAFLNGCKIRTEENKFGGYNNASDVGNIQFESYVYRFGYLNQGEVAIAQFLFQNNGSEPIIIRDVKTGCVCSEVFFPKAPVAPDNKGVVEVKFNTRGRVGKQRHTVLVYTDSSTHPTRLHLTATIN